MWNRITSFHSIQNSFLSRSKIYRNKFKCNQENKVGERNRWWIWEAEGEKYRADGKMTRERWDSFLEEKNNCSEDFWPLLIGHTSRYTVSNVTKFKWAPDFKTRIQKKLVSATSQYSIYHHFAINVVEIS